MTSYCDVTWWLDFKLWHQSYFVIILDKFIDQPWDVSSGISTQSVGSNLKVMSIIRFFWHDEIQQLPTKTTPTCTWVRTGCLGVRRKSFITIATLVPGYTPCSIATAPAISSYWHSWHRASLWTTLNSRQGQRGWLSVHNFLLLIKRN